MTGTEPGTPLWQRETVLWTGRPEGQLAILPRPTRNLLVVAAVIGTTVLPAILPSLPRLLGSVSLRFKEVAILALLGPTGVGTLGWAHWLAARTAYLVTNRRVLVLRRGHAEPVAWIGGHELKSMRLVEGRHGTGDLLFVRRTTGVETAMLQDPDWTQLRMSRDAIDRTSQVNFIGIPDANAVFDLVNRTFKPWHEGNA